MNKEDIDKIKLKKNQGTHQIEVLVVDTKTIQDINTLLVSKFPLIFTGLKDPEEMVSKGFSRHLGLMYRSNLSRVRGSISHQGQTSPTSLEPQDGFSLHQGLVPLPVLRDLLGPSHLPDSPPLPNPILPQRVSNRWEKLPQLQTLSLKTNLLRPQKHRLMIKHPPRLLLPKESWLRTSLNQEMGFSSKATPFPKPLSRLMHRTNLKTRAREWLTNPNPHQKQPRRLCPLSLLSHRHSLQPVTTRPP